VALATVLLKWWDVNDNEIIFNRLSIMRIQKDKISLVKNLYYEQLYSMKEVAQRLGVSRDAVYYFMRKYNLERRNFVEANKVVFDKKPLSFSPKRKLSILEKRLKLAGVMLYWCEGWKGSKGHERIDFVNSDPAMIDIFMRFLRNICGVKESKLRALLYCYSNQNIRSLIKFWSKITQIPIDQFTKPYIRMDFDVHKQNKMPYGLVHIRYTDKKLFLLIKYWLNIFTKEFIKGR
jgi:predicted DNA-binding protein YlxM (UPF0122 family)